MEVEVGQIVNTHGIKGEVKVKSILILLKHDFNLVNNYL